MSDFKTLFQSTPTQFLTLSTEVSEPFIIPNVSPTSSPVLAPVEEEEPVVNEKERSVSIIELN